MCSPTFCVPRYVHKFHPNVFLFFGGGGGCRILPWFFECRFYVCRYIVSCTDLKLFDCSQFNCAHWDILTLARIRCFATFGRTGGLVGATPLGVSIRSVVELSGKDQQIALALAIGGIVFGPRSIFDPVMAGQRSNFRKFYDFSTLRVHISKTIYRSGMGPSQACSPFNSAQNEVFWRISVEYLGRVVLINDAVSHRWRHRSDLWCHGSVTCHTHMYDLYIYHGHINGKRTLQIESTTSGNGYNHKLCDLR